MPRTRRTFTGEFKREAVKLVKQPSTSLFAEGPRLRFSCRSS